MKRFCEKHSIKVIIGLFCILLTSCGLTESIPDKTYTGLTESEIEQNNRIEALVPTKKTSTNLVITTIDEKGDFLDNVNLKIGLEESSTDSKGRKIIENIYVNEGFVFIEASKIGYEVNKKTITPSPNGLTIVEIMLLNDVPSQTMSASDGANLTFGDVKLEFPRNAIVDANGATYKGTVNVNTVFHDPTGENFTRTQPGAMVGITDQDEVMALVSEGMITVDLTDNSGNELNIAEDKTVELTMPASSNSPNVIPLWHLNETHGLWVEVGEAIKKGDVYEFEVSHFSSYNLDWKTDPISKFCIKFMDTEDNLMVNQNIKVNYAGTNYRHFTTDNKGEICFLRAPQGDYVFELDMPCGELVNTSLNVTGEGDYNATFDLSSLTLATYFDYSGTVTFCDNELAKNKAFTIELLDGDIRKYLFGFSDENGNYSAQSLVCGITPGVYSACVHILDDGFDKANNFDLDLSENNFELNLSACDFVIGISDNTIIPIPDENFATTLRNVIGLSEQEPIKYSHLQSVDSLYISPYLPVANFEGLEYLINVQSITFDRSLPAVSMLENLSGLKTLTLIETGLEDLNSLNNLTFLETLILQGSPYAQEDIDALQTKLFDTEIITYFWQVELFPFDSLLIDEIWSQTPIILMEE